MCIPVVSLNINFWIDVKHWDGKVTISNCNGGEEPQRDSVVTDRTWTLSHDTHTLRSIPLIFYICTPPTSNYCDRAQSVPTRKYKMCTRVLKTNTYPWLCVVPILTIKSLIFCTQNQENWWKIGKFDDHGKFEFFTFWNRSVPLARSSILSTFLDKCKKLIHSIRKLWIWRGGTSIKNQGNTSTIQYWKL